MHHLECSGGRETLEIVYKTVSSVTDPEADVAVITEQLRQHMESHYAAELASRLCLSGPHKDDLLVTIDGRDAKSYASQGQTRSLALAMKLAEGWVSALESGGDMPVFLFDDVLSELDVHRRNYLVQEMQGRQVIMTACDPAAADFDDQVNLIHVKDGTYIQKEM